MADALVSPPVAITTGLTAMALIGVASSKVSKIRRDDIIPLMGVMGAFVFAAQMINFSIPGTGSSGHIIGGVLLASMLGPWAAFITLSSVLIIQCLLFADGGLLALGCNIINMASMSCLVAFPLIYRPIAGNSLNKSRIFIASIAACVIGLELGAFLVTCETELSGITALPFGEFLMFMLPIHLAIGVCEGVATALVICFVSAYRPSMLYDPSATDKMESYDGASSKKNRFVIVVLIVAALAMAIGFTWIASSNPDGLEWSILNITGDTELAPAQVPATAILPDYDSKLSGLIGGAVVVTALWGICSLIFRKRKAKQRA